MKPSGLFLDAGVFIGALIDRDAFHEASQRLLRRAATHEWGRLWTSDLVFAEVLTYLSNKRAPPRAVQVFLAFTRGTEARIGSVQNLLRVSGPAFNQAVEVFLQTLPRRLSFPDCGTLVLLEARGIGTLATFDGPLAAEARRRGIEVVGVPETA